VLESFNLRELIAYRALKNKIERSPSLFEKIFIKLKKRENQHFKTGFEISYQCAMSRPSFESYTATFRGL
jgi:hypothetical protein